AGWSIELRTSIGRAECRHRGLPLRQAGAIGAAASLTRRSRDPFRDSSFSGTRRPNSENMITIDACETHGLVSIRLWRYNSANLRPASLTVELSSWPKEASEFAQWLSGRLQS